MKKSAGFWANQFSPGDDGHAELDHLEFSFNRLYDLSKFGSVEDWSEWFREEREMWAEEGRPDYYDDIVEKEIAEPVVIVEIGEKSYIWDGNHRVGGSLSIGRVTIPAIVGTVKPEYRNLYEVGASIVAAELTLR
ncbi:hypothetical protein [Thalassospira xiamenensis]|nr:hypothetical protein [Thalassospira xiamenensis]